MKDRKGQPADREDFGSGYPLQLIMEPNKEGSSKILKASSSAKLGFHVNLQGSDMIFRFGSSQVVQQYKNDSENNEKGHPCLRPPLCTCPPLVLRRYKKHDQPRCWANA